MNVLSIENPEEALRFLEMELLLRQLKEAKWKTKTGELVSLENMEDGHLKNTIIMLKQHLDNDCGWFDLGNYSLDDNWWKND